ncbi:MAG: polysaccharide pyruvyl transferase family protein [Clostridiales bacterium]|nr:polysaccharide pyruvyl transferase family protein [Clostridiales bacterium]
MSDFAMYFHSGSKNKGCEAIVRSTTAMLKSTYEGCTVRLYSFNPESDYNTPGLDGVSGLFFDEGAEPLSFIDRVRLKLQYKKSQKAADEYYFEHFLKDVSFYDDKLFLSIGGDNYFYGENAQMSAINTVLKRYGKKTVLWGCSLDEKVFTDYNINDLKRYDAIFARESETVRQLKEHGFEDNVYQFADPAFALETEKLPLPEGFIENETIGINASPLVFNYETENNRGTGIMAYKRLIEMILNETDCNIALIPHVFLDSNDDRTPLTYLYNTYKYTGRVILLDKELESVQLKGYIARCKAFVGARTHSTIAAYSSLVPTLVLGYSIKSKGIAEDIFGTSEGLVIPIGEISDEYAMANAFRGILDNYDNYKAKLESVMPSYIASSYAAAAKLREL